MKTLVSTIILLLSLLVIINVFSCNDTNQPVSTQLNDNKLTTRDSLTDGYCCNDQNPFVEDPNCQYQWYVTCKEGKSIPIPCWCCKQYWVSCGPNPPPSCFPCGGYDFCIPERHN